MTAQIQDPGRDSRDSRQAGETRKRAIAIVGMHRSGTSVVAGVVHKLGIAIGSELIAATSYNPLGHFEDVAFQRLNTAILHRAGGDWDSPPPRERLLAAAGEYREAIRSLVQDRAASGELWGWKEPRTTLLLPVYRDVIPGLRVVHCVRESGEVERSLQRRNGFGPDFSRKLKRHYDRQTEWFHDAFPDIPFFTVDFRDLREDPERAVSELAEFILPDSPEPTAVKDASDLVLAPAALRQRSKRADDVAYLVRAAFKRPWRIVPVVYWRIRRAYWRRRWDERT